LGSGQLARGNLGDFVVSCPRYRRRRKSFSIRLDYHRGVTTQTCKRKRKLQIKTRQERAKANVSLSELSDGLKESYQKDRPHVRCRSLWIIVGPILVDVCDYIDV